MRKIVLFLRDYSILDFFMKRTDCLKMLLEKKILQNEHESFCNRVLNLLAKWDNLSPESKENLIFTLEKKFNFRLDNDVISVIETAREIDADIPRIENIIPGRNFFISFDNLDYEIITYQDEILWMNLG